MSRSDRRARHSAPTDAQLLELFHLRACGRLLGSTVRHRGGMNSWDEPFLATRLSVMSRAELLACGATSRGLTAAVKLGHLVRARRDHYCLPDIGQDARHAVRVGGRIGCVSALKSYGVFAYDTSRTHIHLARTTSRLRAPTTRLQPLTQSNRRSVVLHWLPLFEQDESDEYRVGLLDALAQSICCQHPWHALASVDNALNLGLIDESDVAAIFECIPVRHHYLKSLVDGRAEAGQETVLRMIVRERGFQYELQPIFDGIGRADILVEKCTILEADSRAHHDGWERHVVDRERDLRFAQLGYPSLRPAYQHTMHHPQLVGDAIAGLVNGRR